MNPLKISLTGGTGFVGRELTRQLLGAGHRVRLLTRHSRRRAAGPESPERVAADFSSPASLARACAGTDALIHLVGIISECPPSTFERVHVDLTRSVIGATTQAGVRRYLHMSALGTRPEAVSRYHRTKWAAEELVRASDLDWTIFRPSLIHGPEDGFTRLFARISAWSPVLPVMGSGVNRLQPVAVAQVAHAFVAALGSADAIRRTYDLCGPERLTFVEILRTLLAAHGRRRFLLHVPLAMARLQARVLEVLFPAVLRRAPPLNRDQLLMLAEDNVGDGAAADAEFGLRHRSLADELRRLAARECADLAVERGSPLR